jgi:hypothetical protein
VALKNSFNGEKVTILRLHRDINPYFKRALKNLYDMGIKMVFSYKTPNYPVKLTRIVILTYNLFCQYIFGGKFKGKVQGNSKKLLLIPDYYQ